MTHYGRPAYDPINSLYVICGDDGNVYSWAIGDVSVALEHDFGGTIKCRGLYWSNIDQRLYAITEDSGSGDFGHFTNRTGTWSWNSLDTTYAFLDFHVNSTATRLFALKSNGDLGLYSIAADGTLAELDTETPGTGELPSGTIVAVTFRAGQGYYAQYDDGSVGYLVEEDDLSGDWFTILTSAHAAGSPGLALSNSSLFGYACTLISAADHIVRFPYDDEDLGTADVIDKGAVGDTLRGLAMARIGIAPPSDAPSDLTATANGATQIDLAWTDNATGETGQRIAWTDDGWVTTNFIIIAADETTYSHTGRTAETEYCYKIQAFNASGASEYSNIDCATTAAAPAEVMVIGYVSSGVGNPHMIDVRALSDGSLVTSFEITGTFGSTGNLATGKKMVAYHAGIDRILWGTSDGKIYSAEQDGTNHVLCYDDGGAGISSIDCLDSGNVWIDVFRHSRLKFLNADVNQDTTWGTPDWDDGDSAVELINVLEVDGVGQVAAEIRTSAVHDLYAWRTFGPPSSTLIGYSDDGFTSAACYDNPNRLLHYSRLTDVRRRSDTDEGGVGTVVSGLSPNSGASNLVLHDGRVYWGTGTIGSRKIMSYVAVDGSDQTDLLTGLAYTGFRGIEITSFV
jgi:hypothetical protein